MRKLIAALLVLMLLPAAVSFAEEVSIGQHYTLFLDASYFPGGKGSSLDYNSITIDLYVLSDESAGYIIVSRCQDGLFLTSGFARFVIVKKDTGFTCVYPNGEYFTAEYDENGADLWVTYDYKQYRLRPVAPASYFDDMR